MSMENVSSRSKSPTYLGSDINESVMRDLVKKRGTIKGRLTLFEKYVSSFETAQLMSSQLVELRLRSDKAKSLFNEFNTIQTAIDEIVVETDNFSQQLEIRELFENSFYQIMTRVTILLEQSITSADSSEQTCNAQSSVRLPVISLPTFDGSFDSWLEYRDTYISMIHNSKQLDDIQKFHYLRSSLVGKASQVIKSVEFTRENYAVAWDLLTNRFNNTKLLVHNHVKAIFSMPNLHKESSIHIRNLIDNVLKNLRSLKSLGEPTESWDTLINYIIVSKFDPSTEKDWEYYKNTLCTTQSNRRIILKDLIQFLTEKADTLEIIKAHTTNLSHTQYNKTNEQIKRHPQLNNTVHTFTSARNNASAVNRHTRSCVMCHENHSLYTCNKFITLSVKDRLEFVKSKNLCVNCLRSGHKPSECYYGPCKQCPEKHNSLLHFTQPNSFNSHTNVCDSNNSSTVLHTVEQSVNQFVNHNNSLNTVLLSTALVEVAGNDNVFYTARALLDSGSQHCIISNSLRNKLNVKSIQSTVTISGIGHSVTQSNQTCKIMLKSLNGNFNTRINCIVLNHITATLPANTLDHQSLNIPSNIPLADPSFGIPAEIDLLIGADYFWDLLLDGRIRLPNGPHLQNTVLGWIISGVIYNHKSYNKQFNCNFVQTAQLNDQLKMFWEIEEIDQRKNCLSIEERSCEKLFLDSTTREENGRFVVRIPLNKPVETLGDSFSTAHNRFLSLERRLERNPQYKKLYSDFMHEYLSLGHMTRIENYISPCYFIPHHGVYRDYSTTTKLRVVFEANVKTSSGYSLNDIQMVGPPLQNDLFSILLSFRQHKFVACGDIEKMYRQVLVQPDQRNLQLILWRNNPTDPLGVYQLNVVTYGTASAPYLSMRCLRQLAHECNDDEISQIIINNFFVDDLFLGHNCKNKLSTLCKKVSDVCMKGCFPLRKWISNSPDIAINIQTDLPNISKSLLLDENYSNRTLGLGWYNNSDEFHFLTKINVDSNHTITKRIILSVVSQIYDPLGFLAPVVIVGKILLQKLWLCNVGWDDRVPNDIMSKWNKFIQSLSSLETIRVPRHVIGETGYSRIELHIFVDASEAAYGACAYIRTCYDSNISTRLLCSKSRVAPIKSVSVPRLELCGALLGAKLAHKITNALSVQFDSVVFWTDSTIVLGWLRMPSHQLKTFVQNRVVEINELTCNAIWLHVSTRFNSADVVTRGTSVQELCSLSLWWNGPPFLQENITDWSQTNDISLETISLPEIKQSSVIAAACRDDINDLINISRFSNFNRLQRSFSYVMRFIHNVRTKVNDRRCGPLSVKELHDSSLILIKFVQQQSFPIEYNSLINKSELKSNRNLNSLNVFLDENNILRVGGRLTESMSFTYDKKHPILLCSKHDFTAMLFRYEHLKLLHAGPQLLLAHIRETWWPINGRNLARKIVRQCVTCSRIKHKTIQPIMGNLPKERITQNLPFIHCGVDYAGPLYILNRSGRGAKLQKSYLCLFVCFVTKAVHLELVTCLSSNSYIMALKRFISRRGKPSQIFSDNGKNFVGAARELTDFLQNNTQSVLDFASDQKIEFRFIPPYSPHFGGLWERGIASCKHHITRVVKNVNLTYEEFSTVLVQIEAVLNSRPLYPMSSDPNDLNPLTPSHFLIGRPLTSPAEQDVTATALPALTRFKRLEQLRQSFWKRWSMEYISELQKRTKWQTKNEDIREGSLVLIKEDGLPPLKWSMGRVTGNLFPGKDGVSRVAEIRTANGIIRRSFAKLCPLPVLAAPATGADEH